MSESPNPSHEISSTRQSYENSYDERRPSSFPYNQHDQRSSDVDESSWSPLEITRNVILTSSRPYDGPPYAALHIGGDFLENSQFDLDHPIGNYPTTSDSVEEEHVARKAMEDFVCSDESLYELKLQPQTPTQQSLGLLDEQIAYGLVQQYASLRAPLSVPSPSERIGQRSLDTESTTVHHRQQLPQSRIRQIDNIQQASPLSSSLATVGSQENSHRTMNEQSGLTHVSENESTPGRFLLFDPTQHGESSTGREKSKKKRIPLDQQSKITKKRKTSVCQRCKKNKEAVRRFIASVLEFSC